MMPEFLKDPKFYISAALLVLGGGCIFFFPNSQPHLILGTNVISGVAGYWLGTSISSANKDKALFKPPVPPQ